MLLRKIPDRSVEIQTGLWLHEYNKTINGTEYTFRQLYSSEGYCFYIASNDEYDEEGNLIRIYHQYASLALSYSSYTNEQLNTEFVSVPVEEGIEIA